MKVLSMAWKIYDERLEAFANNCTGAGMVIKDICEHIGRKVESYLFIGQLKLPEMQLGHIHIIDTETELDVKDFGINDNERHLRTMTNAFKNAIDKIQPDIVNFHGTGELMQRCLQVCIKNNIPYVYTEHLFISKDRKYEKYDIAAEQLNKLYKIPGIKIIAVSTGVKRKILQDFPSIDSNDIKVITNGTNFNSIIKLSDFKVRFGLENKKVLLCVGTILDRKNQCQIVKAFQLLPSDLQKGIKIIFCGRDSLNGKLQEVIAAAGLQDKLIYVGTVNSENMKKYYSIADGLIMPSYAEGLSIASLEAIAYGLPVIMFSDSECADDLHDEKVVCFAKDRSDFCLSEAIETWYKKKWNREYITKFSKHFTMERVAEEYIDCYQNIIRSY